MVTDEELKKIYGMFTDAWKFYKKYAGIQQSEDERWQQLVDESGQIAKKYDNAKLAIALLLAAIDELERKSKILKAACKGLEAISPWILLSVRQGKSFDTLAVRWEPGKIEKLPLWRTEFCSYGRRLVDNLVMGLLGRGGWGGACKIFWGGRKGGASWLVYEEREKNEEYEGIGYGIQNCRGLCQ